MKNPITFGKVARGQESREARIYFDGKCIGEVWKANDTYTGGTNWQFALYGIGEEWDHDKAYELEQTLDWNVYEDNLDSAKKEMRDWFKKSPELFPPRKEQ